MTPNNLRLAFLLQVHKNPEQLYKFIRQITANKNSDVYIHIDRKSIDKFSSRIPTGPHIKIIDESIHIKWGDISQVDATMCLLRNLKKTHKKYDFVFLRSGQDLMVKSGLEDFLARNCEKVFMNSKKVESPYTYFWNIKWPAFARNQYDSVFHPNRIIRAALITLYKLGINILPNPHTLPIDVYRGSSWFCIPGEAASYIVDFVENNPWFYKAFENALAPDEYFFQTIIMSSPYALKNACDNLTHLRFGISRQDNNHAVTFSIKDVPEIENSGKFFARKFDQDIDNEVIEYFCRKCKAEVTNN